jgi:predicted GH43/DUF377 family glycosyl hydrolase
MKRTTVLCVLFAITATGLCGSDTPPPQPWLGIHVMMGSKDATEKLTAGVAELASLGINALVAEINYGYQFESHPELSGGNASSKADIQKLVAECRKYKVRLIPQFQCLGHQSWSGTTFSLLTKHPEFDETPGKYPQNKGIYCRSWCPLHPEVNAMIFDLMDELLKAFEADAMHVGMDEVFLVGDDDCPRCKGKDKAELFAKAITDYHGHLVGKRKVEMLMWGDRLIDSEKISYGEWEASKNGTAGAIDRIPKDIVICDWHYEPRTAYESVPMFVEKGFRVWPASWKDPKSAKALIDYSKTVASPRMVGHLNTTWGSVKFQDLARFEPLLYSVRSFSRTAQPQNEPSRMMFGDSSRIGRPFAKDPSVVQLGGRYLMYYSLPQATDPALPKGWAIGIAESRNMIDWTRIGEILPEQECEQNGLCAPGARVLDGTVHLFYQTYGNGPKDAICHAVSDDGIHFRRDASNPVFRPTGNWNNGRAIDAEVIADGDRLLLYFATRDPAGQTQMLGVAVADRKSDLGRTAWKQLCDAPILKPELPWELRCIEAPTVIRRDDIFVMFYAGGYNNEPQQIGVATSRDGVTWTRATDTPLLANGKPGEWNASESGHPGVFADSDGRTFLFFQGNNDKGKTWFLSRVELGWEGQRPVVRKP